MLSLTLAQVRSRAERAPMVPVFREALADTLTPVSAFAALAATGPAYLLESVEGGERLGRYSFVAADPMAIITIQDGAARLANESGSQVLPGRDPLDALQRYLAGFRAEPSEGLPRFCGGAVGYLGYEAARYLERVPVPDADPLGVPDGVFLISDTLVCFDHVQHRLKLITHVRPGPLEAAYQAAADRLDALEARLSRPVQLRPLRAPRPGGTVDAIGQRSREDFFAAVERAKAYILAGDIYQVQVAQRFQSPVATDPFDIYRVLRTVNPSPYMYFLRLPELTVLGTSPEILVTVEGRQLRYRPIAGTRRRGRDPEHDQRMEAELRSSEMERYSHVMHLVSNITARLREGCSAMDALRACFPAGTVTGAPKIRAMEIIAELEGERRGVYAGAIGYLGFTGDLDTCIAIRTLVVKDGQATVQAAAGVVADSTPEEEYLETRNKASAVLQAMEAAR